MPPLFFWLYLGMVDIPHSEQFDDIYFAVEDGLAESRYVFLEQNHLPDGWMGKDKFVIAETGFGTGLNFLCAWTEFERTTQSHQKLHYYSFEKYPLSPTEIEKYLGHWAQEFDGRLQRLCDLYPMRVGGWHTIRVSDQVTLTLIFDDVNRAIPQMDEPVDCWFLDGHAPAKNPDMWSENVFTHIGRLSVAGARFATFTAAGTVRRGLEGVGFSVGKARGFGSKKDMSVGVFTKEQQPIFVPPTYRNIAVIGGGIAGAAVASALLREGCDVTVFEKSGIAAGASGNIRGLCNPRITALREIESDFYGPAFSLANKLYRDISKHTDIGYIPCGSMHLMTDDRKDKRYRLFPKNWAWHSDHARILDPIEASHIAGVEISHPVLFLPEAAAVCPRLVTEYLAKDVVVIEKNIESVQQIETGWVVDGRGFDAVVLAGGYEVSRFAQASGIPLQKVRGQVTEVKSTPDYDRLKTNLCYSGYASVAENGKAVIGSTFQYWIDDGAVSDADDVENLEKLQAHLPQLSNGLQAIGSRAAFRCAAKDRLPVIGEVDGYKGLYLSTGHASHGLLSAVMAAEMLVVKICGLCQILPRSVEKYLSSIRL